MLARLLLLGYLLAACDDDAAVKEAPAVPDSGPPAVSPDATAPDCFTDPKTSFEIINACTDATQIAKDPKLPLRLADGGLPPLPQ